MSVTELHKHLEIACSVKGDWLTNISMHHLILESNVSHLIIALKGSGQIGLYLWLVFKTMLVC